MRSHGAITVAAADARTCAACTQQHAIAMFSRNQLAKANPKCNDCVAAALLLAKTEQALTKSMKRCVQCFQDRPKDEFSKRQYVQLDSKCKECVAQLEHDATKSNAVVGKWSFDQYYRCGHRGKTGGVAVRTKFNIASTILGTILLGRVFKATQVIYNEQGDPMVKLETLSSVEIPQQEVDNSSKPTKHRDGWVPCRSIRNEILLEPHSGPWIASSTTTSKFYRCVIEGCKVRKETDLSQIELGYVLYGDVVEVVECRVMPDGVVFLCLHERYFDGLAWVVERTLDNESVLNEVEGPSTTRCSYRCVQDGGAPTRQEPSLAAPPVGRIPCGRVITVLERVITPERHVFLRIEPEDKHQVNQPLWVIETSTVCSSVMIRCLDRAIIQ